MCLTKMYPGVLARVPPGLCEGIKHPFKMWQDLWDAFIYFPEKTLTFAKRESIHMTSKKQLIWETHKRRNLWKAAQSCAYQAPSGQVARWDLLQLHLIENALYCIYTTSSTKLFCILRYWLQCIFLLHLALSVLHLPKSDAECGAFLVIWMQSVL